jgi:hypothetical protein
MERMVFLLSRYDKTACNFLAAVHLAATVIRLNGASAMVQQINTSYRYLCLQPAYATIAF